MALERYFLGWAAPLTECVREFLMPPVISGSIDLGGSLIVVPTRQSGRRLRESLASYCAGRNSALLSVRVVTPAFFLHSSDEPNYLATRSEVAAVWADVLMRADIAGFNGLFPSGIPTADFNWALRTGEMISQLRDALADGGYRIEDVRQEHGDDLQEAERWNDLAELESLYLESLAGLGKTDPVEAMIRRAEDPAVPDGVERIVVAAVPDPTPLMVRAVSRLSDRMPVVVLVHAPESIADHFDQWGRPIPDAWQDVLIDIPDAGTNLITAGSPIAQGRKVLELMASEADRFGPGDVAIGVPDDTVVPYVAAELESSGLVPFDPAGRSIAEHPLYRFLAAYRSLVAEGDYAAFSTFLRHGDLLECVQVKWGIQPGRLLEQLDRYQNEHLPLSWNRIRAYFSGSQKRQGFECLARAVGFIGELVDVFDGEVLDTAVRSVLKSVYEVRTIGHAFPDDEEFVTVANSIDEALKDVDSQVIRALKLTGNNILLLFLERLGEQQFFVEREDAIIDLDGWLELPWNDAPFLIITGMNDGSVPSSQTGDSFLPDSLRSLLGLRDDASRLATDAFIMSGLIESRRSAGARICFITGKSSAQGEPLKPSRLLFRCDDDLLPGRARQLFAQPEEHRDNWPPAISFPLRPELPPAKTDMAKLSVTYFKDYLTCPFRFYLKRILGMERLDDSKVELDALDFGSMVHHALQRMAECGQTWRCEDVRVLSEFLLGQAEEWVRDRFGSAPPMQVEMQLRAAGQRLAAAARVQTRLVADGWDIAGSELRVEMNIGGIMVSGRIDRIDRKQDTGQMRILDYKTSEKAVKPETAHLLTSSPQAREYARLTVSNKEKRWGDLQLPLYCLMVPDEYAGSVQVGYFNLPKAVTETDLSLWDHFGGEIVKSAQACAEGVIADILARRFWPPAQKIPYDDFEFLFPSDIAECIEEGSFMKYFE